MDKDVYQAPEAELIADEGTTERSLASRWKRLFASLIDTVILIIVVFGTLFLFGWFDILLEGDELSIVQNLLLGLFGIACFLAVNYKLLESAGQTVGKKILSIRIVSMDGTKALMGDHMLKRYSVYFLPNQIPVAGAIFQLVNILFIFNEHKQCVHDVAGKTIVVNV